MAKQSDDTVDLVVVDVGEPVDGSAVGGGQVSPWRRRAW